MNNKKIFDDAITEFQKIGIKEDEYEIIREKEGIALIRIKIENDFFVFKYFENEDFRREIKIYGVLNDLGIETVKIFGKTEKSILMEDISSSKTLRLGKEEDLSDPDIAKALAKWYKKLHSAGYAYIERFGSDFYSENALITRDNIKFIKQKTKTENLSVWKTVEDNFEKLKDSIEKMRETFNYNDFYYTNLVVAKDKSKAFMLDYNLLGKGPAFSDIDNVCWSLSKEAAEAFSEEYGKTDEKEKITEEAAMVLSSLYLACCKEVFPDWGKELVEKLKHGYSDKLDMVLKI